MAKNTGENKISLLENWLTTDEKFSTVGAVAIDINDTITAGIRQKAQPPQSRYSVMNLKALNIDDYLPSLMYGLDNNSECIWDKKYGIHLPRRYRLCFSCFYDSFWHDFKS
jgi:hypothetical protein